MRDGEPTHVLRRPKIVTNAYQGKKCLLKQFDLFDRFEQLFGKCLKMYNFVQHEYF